ncbi:MAG: J domain-containing protein [Chloroflexota bacterium]
MPLRPPLPADDLYARLEVPVDASFETIEVAWRALLRRHHPDVAGADTLELAKRINVAHDWLSDPDLRDRYDRERQVRIARRTVPPWAPRPGEPRYRPADRARTTQRAEPGDIVARFLDRVSRLTADELDRLDLAEPQPIAFVASIRRFLEPDRLAAVEAMEAAVKVRLGRGWGRHRVRDAVLGFGHELVLGPFLDAHLAEPFRARARERLTRGWDAAVGHPRHGPNAVAVAALLARLAALELGDLRRLAATGSLERLGDPPWPADASADEDEALRVSSILASADAQAAVPLGLDRAADLRARRAAARVAHLLVLEHAFHRPQFDRLVAPWRPLLVPEPAAGARVRRPA